MTQLRQLHLQLAFMGAGTLRKNIQDQSGAIQHTTTQMLFEVSFLAWRKRMIEYHQLCSGTLHGIMDFFQLALADKIFRIR
jgi:hypothetical protein